MTFLPSLKQEAIFFFSIDKFTGALEHGRFNDKALKYDTTPLIGTLASTAHAVQMVGLLVLFLVIVPITFVCKLASKGLKAFDLSETLKFGKIVGGSIAMTLFFVANAATLGVFSYTAKRLQVAGHLPKAF